MPTDKTPGSADLLFMGGSTSGKSGEFQGELAKKAILNAHTF